MNYATNAKAFGELFSEDHDGRQTTISVPAGPVHVNLFACGTIGRVRVTADMYLKLEQSDFCIKATLCNNGKNIYLGKISGYLFSLAWAIKRVYAKIPWAEEISVNSINFISFDDGYEYINDDACVSMDYDRDCNTWYLVKIEHMYQDLEKALGK